MKQLTSTFLLLLVLLCTKSIAQKATGKVHGKLFSDSTHKPVESASVSLVNAKDSTVEKITLSDQKGAFAFSDLKAGDYNLLITTINHHPLLKFFRLSDQKMEVSFDTLTLKFTADSLAAVTVVGYKIPVVLKEDTTEFDAASFKVQENAMVEDLLKKLPGIEIMKDGTVKANGEKVTQVLVDGKPFFGSDPKMATQNLPANIIDKIQVIDQKSEKAQVTKVEDGVRDKVINITIKKDKNRGYFGRAYVGYGTSDRYEERLNANYFNKTRKISLIAGGNNTGRTDYGSGNDESEYTYYNNYNGISKDIQAKLNYIDKWGRKLDVNANIGYGDNQNVSESVRNRQNIFGDSSNFYFEDSRSTRGRTGFVGGFGFEYIPDTLTTVRFNQSGNFGKSDYNSRSVFNSTLSSSKKLNDGTRESNSVNRSPYFNGNLSYSHRFKKRRRALSFNMNNSNNSNFSDGFNISNNYFYPLNSPDYQRLLNQYSNNDSRSTSINTTMSYNEPLSKKTSLNVNVAYNYSKNNSLRELYNFNNLSGFYDLLNDTLSNNFNNFNYSKSVGINYNYGLKKGSVSIGATLQNSVTKSVSLTNDSLYRQSFTGVVPYASFSLFDKRKRITVNYNFTTRAPQPYQLQPVLDNTNPLYIRMGNPNLKFATTHNVNYSYSASNPKKSNNFYLRGNVAFTNNNFSNSTTYNKVTGSQTTQPVNVSGTYFSNGNIGYYTPFKISKQKFNLNTNANFNFARNLSLIDQQKNINNTSGARISAGFEGSMKDWLVLAFGYNANMQSSRYLLKPNLNNTSYTFGGNVRIELRPNKLTELKADWDFSNNTGRSSGFNRHINMINADLTQYFSSKKNLWVKLKVYDLLKQNVSIYRYSGESFIEDTKMNVLTRFFLLSVNARLSKFKAKPTK